MSALFALASILAATQGNNLLLNPSFEQIEPDGHLAHWSAFVMPQAGATAEADPIAVEGTHAAMLHVPTPYAKDPANNWSQIVIADVGGKELTLSGEIRTEAADGAALWLQCFTRNPARVIAAATSAIDRPIAGTHEWTAATVRLAVPKETDFVVVRCVLKGRGSAWFDDLRLQASASDVPALPPLEPGPEVTPVSADASLRDTDPAQLAKMLQQSVVELQNANSRVIEQVKRIKAELDKGRAAVAESAGPLEATEPRHPLVPHGVRAQGDTP